VSQSFKVGLAVIACLFIGSMAYHLLF